MAGDVLLTGFGVNIGVPGSVLGAAFYCAWV